MMSLTEPETQALGSLADGLAGSDPRLASMLAIFSRRVRGGAGGAAVLVLLPPPVRGAAAVRAARYRAG